MHPKTVKMNHKRSNVPTLASTVRDRRPLKSSSLSSSIKRTPKLFATHHYKIVAKDSAHGLLRKALPLIRNIGIMSENKEVETVDLLRSTMRGMFGGDKVYEFYIAATNTIFSSAAGAINFNRTWGVDIALCANWAALITIFDEFCILESIYSFSPCSAGFNVASPAPTFIAFDDDNATGAPTTAAAVVAYPNCAMILPAVQGATLATEANSTGMHPYKYSHRRPYPTSKSEVSISAASTGWTTTSNPAYCLGELLAFNANTIGSSTKAYDYLVQFKVGFRCIF
jgi:hypothetical protein